MAGLEQLAGMFLALLIMIWGLAFMFRGSAGIAWVNRMAWKHIVRPLMRLGFRAVRGLARLAWRGFRGFWRIVFHRRTPAARSAS